MPQVGTRQGPDTHTAQTPHAPPPRPTSSHGCLVPRRTVLLTLTSAVVLVITTDWISWDKLNRGFLPSDEVSRAFLASFILVFDLLIVMQVSVPVVSSPCLQAAASGEPPPCTPGG